MPVWGDLNPFRQESDAGRGRVGAVANPPDGRNRPGGMLSAMTLQNFIDGEYTDGRSGRTMDVVDPSTGAVYLRAPNPGPEDVDPACRAAATAFTTWRRTTPAERS